MNRSIEKCANYFCMMVSAFLLSLMIAGQPAHAISIEIGISKSKATRALVNNGYNQIKILRSGFKTLEAHACLKGTRYKVKVDSRYRIKNTQNIGPCRRTVPIQRIQQNLEKQGYTRVVLENQNGNYVAIACLETQRVRLTFSQQGRLLQERKIGRCENILEPNDIRQVLRDQGYNRIRFTDRQLPWYVAEACRNNRRYELRLTRFGEIRKKTSIGRCDPPIDPRNLVKLLRDKGYDRIEIINDKLPAYQAEACFEENRVNVQLNRFGSITSRNVIGKCRSNMTEQEITNVLKQEGFTRISVTRKANGRFNITACLDGFVKYATLNRFGELISERDGERCPPRNIGNIYDRLSRNGFDEIEFYAEGCRNGRRIRLLFDQNGDRVGRERLGNC